MVIQVPRWRRMVHGVLHWTIVLLVALGLTLAMFLVLPVMETIGKPPTNDLELTSVDTADVPPPPAPPEPEAPPPPKPEEEPPELQEPAQPLDLAQLELALNPSLAGDWTGGDFAAVKLSTMAAAAADGGAGGGDALFSLADLDQKPRALHQPSPTISPELRRRAPGSVHILFLVGTDGRVENPVVQKSSDPIFEAAALAAVKQWKFEPGRRNGQPVRFRMRVPITFPQS